MRIIKLKQFDPVWLKLTSFLTVMFFIYMSDGMLSDFVPGFLESRLGSTLAMGVVMSTSSIAGIILDLMFAQLFRGFTINKLIRAALFGGMVFAGLLYGIIYWPVVLIMVSAMAAWGLYFEFLGFAQQQYIAEIATPVQRPPVWAVLEMIRSIAYAIGPLIGAFFIQWGEKMVLWGAMGILFLAYVCFSLIRIKSKPVELLAEHIDLRSEIYHWLSLGSRVWPILLMSFVLILVDATFWSIGTIINDELASINKWGGLLMTTYMISSLIVGPLILKLRVSQRKKRWAQIFMMLGGTALACFGIFHGTYWYLLVTFASSAMFALSWPLVDAVYTDLLVRLGRERQHLIGLCSSMNSMGYIVGPILAGGIAGMVGLYNTFVVLGIGIALAALLLIVVTPRKLQLPQSEIETWK